MVHVIAAECPCLKVCDKQPPQGGFRSVSFDVSGSLWQFMLSRRLCAVTMRGLIRMGPLVTTQTGGLTTRKQTWKKNWTKSAQIGDGVLQENNAAASCSTHPAAELLMNGRCGGRRQLRCLLGQSLNVLNVLHTCQVWNCRGCYFDNWSQRGVKKKSGISVAPIGLSAH